ncbi:transcription factor MYB3R-1-like [Lycium ferocissimum]|uniref:transcription factor MYB3R-1-like n=1 Tax=Lycium ferocissimum TaxID=112874 RepID=UPI0028163172|nr:transcription factor MYB3R-1-like [Lycium ferocissimum]XP_059275221.1 transcription factor MYB3R-1-like [Lycium ferocissimum]
MESDRISTPSDGTSTSLQSNSLQRVRPLHGRTSGPTRRSTKGQWTPEEDEILRKAVQRFKGKNWKKIAECFKDRTDVQCLHRWQKVLNPELVKGPWSKEEDEVITELVKKYGPKKWSTIAQHLPGRIGKQCRERWHNHLNPGINKEAWTQEEELTLIRAHQIYGNKWAELTKFLPGRTDNAIKNHWNSSVKKKLDSYLASGLLAQFPSLPNFNHQIQSIPSSTKMEQSSEDDSVRKGAEMEEVSECSQGSNLAGCSQSTSDMGNAFVHTREEGKLLEDSNYWKDPSSSSAPCSEYYAPNFDDITFSMAEVPSGWAASMGKDWQFNPDDIPNISPLELMQDSSGLFMQCLTGNGNHDMVTFPQQDAMKFETTNDGSMVVGLDTPNEMFTSVEGCTMIYPEAGIPQRFPSETGMNGVDETAGSLIYQISEGGNMSIEKGNPLCSDVMGTSSCQPCSVPSEQSSLMFGIASNQFHNPSQGHPAQESETSKCDGLLYPTESDTPCDNIMGDPLLKDPLDQTKDSAQLVSVDDFGSTPSNTFQTCPLVNGNSGVKEDQKDGGALCYEPPRFPSLDVPFFSCDLIQSGNDPQQDYSPLGIRQLMMSSMNCLTPFRLWDSPSRDGSPDAVLRSAAKTFTSTPSILKKRHRDLVSPLSEKRCGKKLESDLRQESFSSLAKDFSRLDVMFDDSANEKATMSSLTKDQTLELQASSEDKENINPTEDGRKEDDKERNGLSGCGTSERQLDGGELHCKEQGTRDGKKLGANEAVGKIKQPSGVLVELNASDLFFSPDRFGAKSDRATNLSNKAIGNQYARRLEAASNQGSVSSSFETSCFSVICSPRIRGKKDGSSFVITTSMQSAPTSTALENAAETSGNVVGTETVSISGETPYKRSIESPSAWKSPWFLNSFLSSPRLDNELTFEDLALFMSPGDRSYDAIGLMKQLSEQTAGAFADAQEVLGGDTPESILRGRNSKNQKADENHSLLSANAMSERRTLDFSECESPGKGKATENFGTSNNSFSSPSSYYLLKGCR